MERREGHDAEISLELLLASVVSSLDKLASSAAALSIRQPSTAVFN